MRQMVMKEPVGPVAAFVAWNFPAVNVMRKVAGALAAGCSINIKASAETPATCIAIARCLTEAGVPDGVVNLVFGVPDEVSRHLLASSIPRKLSFTGSVPVGKHLQSLAAATLERCTMELGGHAPVIVFDDADLDASVAQAVAGKFRNAGQVCVSPTRFYVQEKVYDEFAGRFAEKAAALEVCNGLEDGVAMGPLIAERIGNQGYFYAPTVLEDVLEDALIMNEEPFGPLAPMASFKSFDEVMARANKLELGLAAYAFTKDGARAQALAEQIETGLLAVNSLVVSTPETPFGGVNESGYGSEGAIEGLVRTTFVTETGV